MVNDAVDGGIAHKGSVFGFLFFEGEDAFKVGVHGGEHFQGSFDIVFFAWKVYSARRTGNCALVPRKDLGFVQEVLVGGERLGFVVEGEDLAGSAGCRGKIFGWEGVYQIT